MGTLMNAEVYSSAHMDCVVDECNPFRISAEYMDKRWRARDHSILEFFLMCDESGRSLFITFQDMPKRLYEEPVKKGEASSIYNCPMVDGARIRECVNAALDKGSPEWAKEILKNSISKEVYKGNVSGSTKKAVLSVLATVCGEGEGQKPLAVRAHGGSHEAFLEDVQEFGMMSAIPV